MYYLCTIYVIAMYYLNTETRSKLVMLWKDSVLASKIQFDILQVCSKESRVFSKICRSSIVDVIK